MTKLLLFTIQKSQSQRHCMLQPCLPTLAGQSGGRRSEQKLERLRCDSERESAIYKQPNRYSRGPCVPEETESLLAEY